MNERPLRVLHVGCGPKKPDRLPPPFNAPPWQEVRLDIDAGVGPDVLASMTDMGVIPPSSFDAVLSSHNIEHLYPHEVPLALAEFTRVLTPQGFVVITLPDLRRIAEWILADRLFEMAYISPAGPIFPFDILYGFRPALAAGNLYMAHRCGFTAASLERALREAGFASVTVRSDGCWSLWAVASVQAVDQAATGLLADTLISGTDDGHAAD